VDTKQDVIDWLEQNRERFIAMSDAIWARPEVAWHEFYASKLQADFLEAEGFQIAWDVGGLNTAFVAEWGEGKPVIGFVGEYDALPGLSQKNQATQEPVVPGDPGHGCGHNLLGAGCLAAAVAVSRWLAITGRTGTVRYYGCPAEEQISGKTFMARDGAFDDLDAAFNFHPGRMNSPTKGSAVGVYDYTFRFHGKTAHAGGSPQLGRSALDAVELMNVGVNYLREHVPSKVRIHYAITHGGDVPNIVPAEASVWYFIRATNRQELDEVTERVQKIAQGAALMTETTMEAAMNGACSTVLSNAYMADLQYEAMKVVGPIEFSDEERAYAQAINDAFPAEGPENLFKELRVPEELRELADAAKGQPLVGENWPAMDEEHIQTGSTDVGDVSWITPLSELRTACFATGAAGHSWGVSATCGMSIGHKGMMHAAKIMALAAMDLYTEPEHLRRARAEFDAATRDHPYQTPLPDSVRPPQIPNPLRAG
jgi:aminobenzoyl-glutamate utilization protein B